MVEFRTIAPPAAERPSRTHHAVNAPSPPPPNRSEPFPFGVAFRAVCIVFFVIALTLCIAGLDSDKIMSLGGLSIALFFVSLWFSELRRGEILTQQHEGVSRWEDPAKFRRVMIGQALFLSIILALMAIGTFKAFFDAKPEPHAESAEGAERDSTSSSPSTR